MGGERQLESPLGCARLPSWRRRSRWSRYWPARSSVRVLTLRAGLRPQPSWSGDACALRWWCWKSAAPMVSRSLYPCLPASVASRWALGFARLLSHGAAPRLGKRSETPSKLRQRERKAEGPAPTKRCGAAHAPSSLPASHRSSRQAAHRRDRAILAIFSWPSQKDCRWPPRSVYASAPIPLPTGRPCWTESRSYAGRPYRCAYAMMRRASIRLYMSAATRGAMTTRGSSSPMSWTRDPSTIARDHDTQPDRPSARHHVLLGANGDHGIDPGRAHHRHDAGHERHAEEHDRAGTERDRVEA